MSYFSSSSSRTCYRPRENCLNDQGGLCCWSNRFQVCCSGGPVNGAGALTTIIPILIVLGILFPILILCIRCRKRISQRFGRHASTQHVVQPPLPAPVYDVTVVENQRHGDNNQYWYQPHQQEATNYSYQPTTNYQHQLPGYGHYGQPAATVNHQQPPQPVHHQQFPLPVNHQQPPLPVNHQQPPVPVPYQPAAPEQYQQPPPPVPYQPPPPPMYDE